VCRNRYRRRHSLRYPRRARYRLLYCSLSLGPRLANDLLSLLASYYLRSSKVLADCNRAVVLYRQRTSVDSLRSIT
jgi:hypothetical protein